MLIKNSFIIFLILIFNSTQAETYKFKNKEANIELLINNNELNLIKFEYEFGLFKQYQINSNMDLFKSNQLNIVTSTILAKPIIKIASLMSYEGQKLNCKDDFRFEKRSLYSLIVKPKKSLFFNKMTYKNSLDVSLEMFSK